MSLLSNRVQISKQLKYKYIPSGNATKVAGSTISNTSGNHYQVFLAKFHEVSTIGNEQLSHDTITVECHCNTGNGKVTSCKGNSRHTICKHSLGFIRFHLDHKDCTIAFCNSIFDAIKLRYPSQNLVKIVSRQGRGILWGVVSRSVKSRLETNTLALHGTIDEQNGID